MKTPPPVPIPALLLLGPTGSGKTPLGERLERLGLRGRRCLHFDFGARLREAAADPGSAPCLSAGDLEVVRRSLATGALLEDADFPIAACLLAAFLEGRGAGAGDLLVLNGLPRHEGQARALASTIEVRAVALLDAPAAVVRERIRRDPGADRARRIDDSPGEVERRLETYAGRTAPLVAFYAARGAAVVSVRVGPDDTAEDLDRKLRAALAGPPPVAL